MSEQIAILVVDPRAPRQRIGALAALLAREGFALRPTAGGVWIVSRWNLSRELADEQAVEDFARRVGAIR